VQSDQQVPDLRVRQGKQGGFLLGHVVVSPNRVAERAGISVGSLYHYYPNKAALLFRLHELENSDKLSKISALLGERERDPRDRILAAVRVFFETEAAEAPLREALVLASMCFRGSDEFEAVEARAVELIRRFLLDTQPNRRGWRDFDARFVSTVLASVSESVTKRGAPAGELRRWADRCSEMLCGHLGLRPTGTELAAQHL
jgi:AcrR family transcriptional regulator